MAFVPAASSVAEAVAELAEFRSQPLEKSLLLDGSDLQIRSLSQAPLENEVHLCHSSLAQSRSAQRTQPGLGHQLGEAEGRRVWEQLRAGPLRSADERRPRRRGGDAGPHRPGPAQPGRGSSLPHTFPLSRSMSASVFRDGGQPGVEAGRGRLSVVVVVVFIDFIVDFIVFVVVVFVVV